MTDTTNAVDEMLPPPQLAALGLQHVLVMYAGAVAVPLIIGRALKLPPEQIAFLISADDSAPKKRLILDRRGRPWFVSGDLQG